MHADGLPYGCHRVGTLQGPDPVVSSWISLPLPLPLGLFHFPLHLLRPTHFLFLSLWTLETLINLLSVSPSFISFIPFLTLSLGSSCPHPAQTSSLVKLSPLPLPPPLPAA